MFLNILIFIFAMCALETIEKVAASFFQSHTQIKVYKLRLKDTKHSEKIHLENLKDGGI